MFLSRFLKPPATVEQLQKMLEDWEYSTCKGSECYSQNELKDAIFYFENALSCAQSGLSSHHKTSIFMQYYSLASINLAHALIANKDKKQSEKALSDAHFNMLELMLDKKHSRSFRREAKQQAKLLLVNLKRYLINIGKNQVAESLEDEFFRLELIN